MPGCMSAYEALLLIILACTGSLVFLFKTARRIKADSRASGHGVGVGLEPGIILRVRLVGASLLALVGLIASTAA